MLETDALIWRLCRIAATMRARLCERNLRSRRGRERVFAGGIKRTDVCYGSKVFPKLS